MGFSTRVMLTTTCWQQGRGFGARTHIKLWKFLFYDVLEEPVEHPGTAWAAIRSRFRRIEVPDYGAGGYSYQVQQAAPSVSASVKSNLDVPACGKTVLLRVMNSVALMPTKTNSWCFSPDAPLIFAEMSSVVWDNAGRW